VNIPFFYYKNITELFDDIKLYFEKTFEIDIQAIQE